MGRLPLSIDPLFSIPPIPLVCGSSAPLQLHFPIPPTTVSGSSAPLHPTLCLPLPPPPTLVCGSSAPLHLPFQIHYSKRVVCPSPTPSGSSAPHLFQAGRLPLIYSKRVVCPSSTPSGSSAPPPLYTPLSPPPSYHPLSPFTAFSRSRRFWVCPGVQLSSGFLVSHSGGAFPHHLPPPLLRAVCPSAPPLYLP